MTASAGLLHRQQDPPPPTVHLKEIASNGHAAEHVGFTRKLLAL